CIGLHFFSCSCCSSLLQFWPRPITLRKQAQAIVSVVPRHKIGSRIPRMRSKRLPVALLVCLLAIRCLFTPGRIENSYIQASRAGRLVLRSHGRFIQATPLHGHLRPRRRLAVLTPSSISRLIALVQAACGPSSTALSLMGNTRTTVTRPPVTAPTRGSSAPI